MSSEDPSQKKELSDRVKAMKFMKRKEETKIRKHHELEVQREMDANHWTVMNTTNSSSSSSSSAVIDPSEEAMFAVRAPGRRSFGGFNANIEKVIADAKQSSQSAALKEEDARETLDDEDFADRYVGLRGKRMSQAANNNKRPKNTNSHHHHHHHQSTSSSGAQPSKPSSLGRLSASDAQNDDLDIPTGYVKPAFKRPQEL